ncbi:hypothetical protein B0T10DRAFT_285501 [Thelonectria olida]|uniref:N-acetyltransferase domain-containing protein n=1 Tax=Thelonectria olida TaxID=1576542 RepID=A0A9P8W644_9HYPO|nr:hypothetical protein B0T10DRAFT_285501 [Thelonectria olida]
MAASNHSITTRTSSPALLWDLQGALPLTNLLSENPSPDESEVVLLLTPAIVPFNPTGVTSDPFEPLGRALTRPHFLVRHVPYTRSNGLTTTHHQFIDRANTIIFVVTEFASPPGGANQFELADVVREICAEDHMMILVAFGPLPDDDLQALGFSTVLQSPGYSPADLRIVASLIMSEQSRPIASENLSTLRPRGSTPPQQAWPVQKWDPERDLGEIHTLWQACLPAQFHLSRFALSSLLRRNGTSMHYVVRSPPNDSIIGFCATFTTFAGKSGDQLVGSIAVIIVREDFRNRGIGRILHEEGWSRLSKNRDVGRIQIGSTFPRLLYGPPTPLHSPKWLEDRGWSLDETGLGRGRLVSDWFLRFAESPVPNLASAGLTFRTCQMIDTQRLLDMVGRECERKSYFGWYDQYARTTDSCHMADVIIGFEGESLVAAAITYVQNSGSPCAIDIPWPSVIGDGIGGVSCICIKDDDPDMANRRDSVIARLLQACRQSLSDRGMFGVFVDGMRSDRNTFMSLGYHRWADYRETWRQR